LKKGCVIANDADYSRAQMLIHQINRSGTAGMAVINHSGQFFLSFIQLKLIILNKNFNSIKFYVVYGATRKLPIKWAKCDGVSLHPLQLSILMKSINLLKKGGLVVYCACSLNPIKNGAVLSGLLKKVGKGL
jgi:multisite-specific tRNA:(cytosine-C5)-methyltransferase